MRLVVVDGGVYPYFLILPAARDEGHIGQGEIHRFRKGIERGCDDDDVHEVGRKLIDRRLIERVPIERDDAVLIDVVEHLVDLVAGGRGNLGDFFQSDVAVCQTL